MFSMVTLQCFLGASLCALLFLKTDGLPVKGSKSQSQSSSGADAGGAAYTGSATGHYAPMSYSVSRDVSRPMQGVGQAASAPVLVQAAPAAGYPGGAGVVPAMPAYPVGGPVVPVLPGAVQPGAAQSGLPETKWTVDPKIFSEEELANIQSSGPGPSNMLPPPPPPPPGPVLQSGETSNVVKEAELGNYQHETEEFGYPAASMGPGQGLPSNPMPYVGGGGYWVSPYPYPLPYPFPYPEFDYRLLYGLYPPGTYTTFSKHHEKGKDYYQNIHYLKDHGPGAPDTPSDPGSGQYQQKLFQ